MAGSGESGQLGIGKTEKEFVPKEVTLIHDRVRQIACGFFHSCILTCKLLDCYLTIKLDDGELYSTGENSFGQLGLGHKNSVNIPSLVRALEGKHVS